MVEKVGQDKNHFLKGGALYSTSRPTYPEALADVLMASCVERGHALDVGCGSGQLSVLLGDRFQKVTATDPSQTQLDSAVSHATVTYKMEPAEQISLPNNSVDLISAAQAAHWFDLDLFYNEVRRIARPNAVIALVTYGVPTMKGDIGRLFEKFYWQDIHSFWPDGRQHVENGYKNLAFPFVEREMPELSISRQWSLNQLIAYIYTWSAMRRARDAGNGRIIDEFIREARRCWPDEESRKSVVWPVMGRLGAL
ncbi:hypothetical protein GCM10007879_07090 [Maritalea porphyrae]|uniref:Methyltransferase type 11 domain-containing protein n=2 Tax=Maritalea porphyrae TaxID=880732 RepID=A0ABQ5UQ69_9HYPH|nr:hypothetical protein GCM10007879_07090 [Maritalea porphyrae]